MAQLSIRALDNSHGVGTWERTLVQIWSGSVLADAVAGMNMIARELIEGGGEPVTSLIVVEPSSPPPNDRARKEIAIFSRYLVSKMALAVIVAEGGDFRSARVRGVILTLISHIPHRPRFTFVRNLDVALDLLAPYMAPRGGGREGLLTALEELRTAVRAQRQTKPEQV